MDPFRAMLNLTDGAREYLIDSTRVTEEEFQATAILADVLWGQQGLAEMLGSTWRMVHDPRFLGVERCGIRARSNVFSKGDTKLGVQVIKAGEFFGSTGSLDSMTTYAEILGEGRHFAKRVAEKGWSLTDPLTEEQIWELIAQECPNYRRRDGSWNKEANTLAALLKAGLVSLVTDYADIAYCTDWIRMDTSEVVPAGTRLTVVEEDGFESEDDTPVVAVEVDNLTKALAFRAQVRMTAYKLLTQFPGITAESLKDLEFTDLESDLMCQTLFSAKWDKLYTVIPQVAAWVNTAKTVPYELRLARETENLKRESQEFNAALKSGEIPHVATEIAETDAHDPSVFVSTLLTSPYHAQLFQQLQVLERRGIPEATALADELVNTHGTPEVWARVMVLVDEHATAEVSENLTNIALVQGMDIKASEATTRVLGEGPAPDVTTVEGVYDGLSVQPFHVVYANPVPDTRFHHTVVVDVVTPDGPVRRTWSLSQAAFRTLTELRAEGESLSDVTFSRRTDHRTGTETYSRQEA